MIQRLYCWPFVSSETPKNSEISSHVLMSLAKHLSNWNGRGQDDLRVFYWFVLIQLFIHLGTVLQGFEPLIFLRFSEMGPF